MCMMKIQLYYSKLDFLKKQGLEIDDTAYYQQFYVLKIYIFENNPVNNVAFGQKHLTINILQKKQWIKRNFIMQMIYENI